MVRTGKWRTDWRSRFGHGSDLPADPRSTLLVHGVSVGEVASIAPLVAAFEQDHAEAWRVVVSATTDTGVHRAAALFGESHPVLRYPFDLSASVGRFLDRVRPDLVALTELEVWPNFVEACTKRGIPVVVISGRLSDQSFARYRKVRRWVAHLFERLEAVGAQTQEYANRFVALGARPERVHVTDTTKWDAAPTAVDAQASDALAAALGIDRTRPLVVAGSTGPDEERWLLEGVAPDVQLLIAPRKPERFAAVAALEPAFVRRSTSQGRASQAPGERRFLLDSMGELETAYGLADIAVVGRSFVPLGGSDPIPPVALGCASIMGPHHHNFRDVVERLEKAGALLVGDDPCATIHSLLTDREARTRLQTSGEAVVRAGRGATARTVELLLNAANDRRSAPASPLGRPPVR